MLSHYYNVQLSSITPDSSLKLLCVSYLKQPFALLWFPTFTNVSVKQVTEDIPKQQMKQECQSKALLPSPLKMFCTKKSLGRAINFYHMQEDIQNKLHCIYKVLNILGLYQPLIYLHVESRDLVYTINIAQSRASNALLRLLN